MVSKAAVIAIVAILAVPILLGYALNVEQVTETDYKTTGDPVNVTPLLQNGTDYSYAHADTYQLNTSVSNAASLDMQPIYQSKSFTKSPLYSRNFFNVWSDATGLINLSESYYYVYGNIKNDTASSYYSLTVYYGDSEDSLIEQATINHVLSLAYTDDNKTLKISYYQPGYPNINYANYQNDNTWVRVHPVGGFIPNDNGVMWGYPKPDDPNGFAGYVDFAAGFRIYEHSQTTGQRGAINFPANTRSALFTMDLNTITDANYSIQIGYNSYYTLSKTTVDGDVTWTITNDDDPTITYELYYDETRSSNTYQIYTYAESQNNPSRPNLNTCHHEYRYVGNWPETIGPANYYQTYDMTFDMVSVNLNVGLTTFKNGYTTPVMRVDDALYAAFEYATIKDQIYFPSSFKGNPATTINNVQLYGPSFTFGGNTYTVTKGNITMGNHDISVSGLVLSSVPNPNGGYDNKIGNTVISTTAGPSSITFNGKWSASITTTAQEEYEITKTEWKAGDFAWDGIDHNFIMAGLLASLGAFVGVGIYARRTRSSVWPLLIVCGGAALLFFVML